VPKVRVLWVAATGCAGPVREEESDGEGRPAPSVWSEGAGTVENIVQDKPATCRLCAGSSASPSPLPDASNEDRYGGFLPWAKYVRVGHDSSTPGKRPAAKQCLICLNVYRSLGLACL
jgi:hypothetical protein